MIVKLGARCWHYPTREAVEVVGLLPGDRARIRPRDGATIKTLTVPLTDLTCFPPGCIRARKSAVYTKSELAASKAWGIKPCEVRKIRRSAK